MDNVYGAVIMTQVIANALQRSTATVQLKTMGFVTQAGLK